MKLVAIIAAIVLLTPIATAQTSGSSTIPPEGMACPQGQQPEYGSSRWYCADIEQGVTKSYNPYWAQNALALFAGFAMVVLAIGIGSALYAWAVNRQENLMARAEIIRAKAANVK